MFYNIKCITFASVFMVLVFKVMKTLHVVMTDKTFLILFKVYVNSIRRLIS